MKLIPVLALALLALLPATAMAGQLWIDRSTTPMTVNYRAFPAETNTVNAHFAVSGHLVNIYDQTGVIATTDSSCSIVHPWQARCIVPLSSKVSLTDGARFNADLGDQDDSFEPTSGTAPYLAVINGGDGIDQITLGRNEAQAPSFAYGGPGNDVFHSVSQPGDSTNAFFGEDGDDAFYTLNGGASDYVSCGNGLDTVRADPSDRGVPDSVEGDCENVS